MFSYAVVTNSTVSCWKSVHLPVLTHSSPLSSLHPVCRPLGSTCSLCQAHHVSLRTLPLRWWASCKCRPHGVATSTHCFLYHLRKQGEQRTMRCHFLNPFVLFYTFFFCPTGASLPVSSSSFSFIPLYGKPTWFSPQDVSSSSSKFPSQCFLFFCFFVFFFIVTCFHSGTVMEGTVGYSWPSPPVTYCLASSLSASEVTGFDQDWPSKNESTPRPNPSLGLNLLYPLPFHNKLFTNSHFTATFLTLFVWCCSFAYMTQPDACVRNSLTFWEIRCFAGDENTDTTLQSIPCFCRLNSDIIKD